jgi:predicted RNA-binding Zn-ribbon protein involved in translation (DUF1610 family)
MKKMTSVSLTCPNCKKSFVVRDDERFDHGCPHCGYGGEEEQALPLDVYVCSCDEEFAVKEDKEPNGCPFCGTGEIEWSHSTK